MNNVCLVGGLTRDPELHEPDGAEPVCVLRLAADNGGGRDLVYVDVVTFGRAARACAEHLARGRRVEVRGVLRLREWEDDDGSRRSAHSVAGRVRFLGRGPGRDGAGGAEGDGDGDGVPDGDGAAQAAT
jgi:single-strand DNA-binding protein